MWTRYKCFTRGGSEAVRSITEVQCSDRNKGKYIGWLHIRVSVVPIYQLTDFISIKSRLCVSSVSLIDSY